MVAPQDRSSTKSRQRVRPSPEVALQKSISSRDSFAFPSRRVTKRLMAAREARAKITAAKSSATSRRFMIIG